MRLTASRHSGLTALVLLGITWIHGSAGLHQQSTLKLAETRSYRHNMDDSVVFQLAREILSFAQLRTELTSSVLDQPELERNAVVASERLTQLRDTFSHVISTLQASGGDQVSPSPLWMLRNSAASCLEDVHLLLEELENGGPVDGLTAPEPVLKPPVLSRLQPERMTHLCEQVATQIKSIVAYAYNHHPPKTSQKLY